MFRERSSLLCASVAIVCSLVLVVGAGSCNAGGSGYKLLQAWGSRGSGDGQFNRPCGVAIDDKGHVYVADSGNKRIQKLTAGGKFVAKWNTTDSPRAVAVDGSGNICVAEAGRKAGLIETFTPEGKLISKWQYRGRTLKNRSGKMYQYSMPGGLAIRGDYVYLGNNSTGSIDKFTTDGKLVKSWGGLRRCCGFLDIAMDKDGNIYVAELGAHRVSVFDPNGKYLRRWGKKGNGKGQFCGCCNPVHITIGPGNLVYTSEKTIPRVQVFTTNGRYLRTFKGGKFSKACGYMDLVTGPSGRIYVVDDANCRICVFGKKSSTSKRDRALYETGENLLRNNKPDLARRYFQQILAKYPNSPYAKKAREELNKK